MNTIDMARDLPESIEEAALGIETSRRLYDDSLRALGDDVQCDCGVRRTSVGYAVRVALQLEGFRVQIDREGSSAVDALTAAFDAALSVIAPSRGAALS